MEAALVKKRYKS